ncbi:MAG: DUF1638 domain-containing protein [Rhodobacteraceae bacterium]|nr:DUF1638 domain-containing protein [Paracoccaceae bacterium]
MTPAPGRVLIIGCGAIAREILAVKCANRWSHVDLVCVPAIFHNHPERITGAVRRLHDAHRATHDTILVAFADCGTGGTLQAYCDSAGLTMISGPHCYAFFQGEDHIAPETDLTAFYLTDFLVRQFDAFVWRPLGLDRHPELREMYFTHYKTLVYLSQTDDAETLAKARACANRLNLAFEHRPTGYGGLASWMTRLADAPDA